MSLQFIFGRAGSGKSTFCIDDIKKEIDKGNDKPLILLVPEQFSFQSEKKILDALGEKGAFKVQVLTFSKMAKAVFDETGGLARRYINSAGRTMLLNIVMEKNSESLKVYKKASRKQGFATNVSALITEFKKYGINYEILNENLNSISDSILKEKLTDLHIIYREYENSLNKKYVDPEDDLTILAGKIEESNIFNDGYIWIDEFTSFTKQEYGVLEKLFKKISKTNITLCTDGKSHELFLQTKNTEDCLIKIIERAGIKYDKPIFLEKYKFDLEKNPELNHLENYLFSYPFKAYKKETKALSIFRALNSYTEVEETAKEIIRLCRDHGIMYRHIAVVTPELETYESLIRVVFQEYGIPYFIDKKSKIINSPLVVLITSALEIISKGWGYEEVFRYLKTGLTGIPREDVDILENYVLANGIKGKGWTNVEPWEKPLNYNYNNREEVSPHETEHLVRINNIREIASSPILKLSSKIKGKRTCRELTDAIYNFLCDINTPETIEKLIKDFQSENQLDRAAEYRQVWDIIIELMDQIVEIIGDETVSLDEYSRIIAAGFQEYEIGIIPPGIDEVLVGSVQRLKSHEISVLFILGVSDGTFPSPSINEGILSDEDRVVLNEIGMEVSKDSKSLAFEEQFLTYSTLTRAKEYLRISFPSSDFQGKSKRPSIIIPKIKRIFPNIVEKSDIIKDESEEGRLNNITAKNPMVNEVLTGMEGKGESQVFNSIYNWFLEDSLWMEKLKKGAMGFNYNNNLKIKDVKKIKDLYGKNLNLTVSRLEKYVQCPFSYFIQYGLKAKDRKIYKLAPPDLGSLMHEALYNFSKNLKSEGINWRDMDSKWAENKISKIVDELVDNSSGSILKSSKRYRFVEENIKKTLKRSLELISLHIKRGDFMPLDYELTFGFDGEYPPISLDLDSGEKVNLSGKIDRVDLLNKDGETYVRIIDYKSGNKEFKISEVYYGLQMQLLIYLDAILTEIEKQVQEKVLPAGVLYFRLDDPMIKTSGEMNNEELQFAIMKVLKMNGLILKNISVVNGMDSELSGTSDIIPVSINKDNSISNRSSCADNNDFDTLRKYVKKSIKKICTEILDGKVAVSPYKKKGEVPCRYCSFSSVCQFDETIPGNKYRILKEKKEEEFWESMKEEIADINEV